MISRIFIFFIRLYQKFISPFFGETCRFHPSCSEYAALALKRHGIAKGMIKAVWRILRCNPLTRGGIDYP